MTLLYVLLLTFIQLGQGASILVMFRVEWKWTVFWSVSFLMGLIISSLLPFLLELLHLPLNFPVLAIIFLLTGLLGWWKLLVYPQRRTLFQFPVKLRMYEWPSVMLLVVFLSLSLWRSWYYPPTPRDLTSGAEVIAEYAVREKTLLNTVYSIDLQSTNNPYKSPFISSLQVTYKYAGLPFGQIWIALLSIAFTLLLYETMKETLHPLLAGWLLVAFTIIPEMYGYTFMALFDYPNAVYFFLACWTLIRFFRTGQSRYWALSGLFMGAASYIRTETLILCGFIMLVTAINLLRVRRLKTKWYKALLYILPSLLIYILTIPVFLGLYLPVHYEVKGQLNQQLTDLSPLWKRLGDMNTELLFGGESVNYFGYFILIFVVLALADALTKREWGKESRNYLYFVLVIYLGLPLLGYLFPLMDLDHSTKRGLFKIFPLMLLFMSRCSLMTWFSSELDSWENEKINRPLFSRAGDRAE